MAEIADLVELIGPSETQVSSPDWRVIENELELVLPDDYKTWASMYPDIEIDRFMQVSNYSTRPNPSGLREGLISDLDVIRDLVDLPVYPEPGGVVSWGSTINGDICMWLPDPDSVDWSIVIVKFDDVWHFDGDFLDFLVGFLKKDVRCPEFPEIYPRQPAIKEVQAWEPRMLNGREVYNAIKRPTSRWRSYFERLEADS